MIKQEITYHKGTYIEKSYKEFSDGVLIFHIEYDKSGNKIYQKYYNGYWCKYKYGKSCNLIYEENSYGDWCKWKDNYVIDYGCK